MSEDSTPAPTEPLAPTVDPELRSRRYELAFGLVLALFAAILALNELAGGKYGDDEIKLASEKTSAYLWYQSKSIKTSLIEGQRSLLESLVETGVIKGDTISGTKAHIEKLGKQLARYELEKKEILLGSKAVGKEGWTQEVDGELGKVTGVKEMEAELETLGAAGDRFDFATLFLQLSIVLGAIGIIVKQIPLKRGFIAGLLTLGTIGLGFSIAAYIKVGIF